MNPQDLAALGGVPGGAITVESRRGKVSLFARADKGMPRGTIFLPFCYHEAAANLLTNPILDPCGKIPELKHCAVRVSAGGPAQDGFGYGNAPEVAYAGSAHVPR